MKENYLTICDLNNTDTFIASSELVAEAKAKNAKQYVNIAYSNYGGTFLDKVLISFIEKDHPNNIVSENSAWQGKNAFIFGDILPQLIEDTNNYLLKFETLEEYFCEMEQKEYDEYIDMLIDEGVINNLRYERDFVKQYLEENANISTTGVEVEDYDLVEAVKEWRLNK